MHCPYFWVLLFMPSFAKMASRQKRNLYNFQKMITAGIGRSAMDYNNYGNWCGKSGKNEPVDDVDRCCCEHDSCYAAANRNQCKEFLFTGPYMIPYKWSVKDEKITCDADQSKCTLTVCYCDKTVVECFAKSKYNPENKNGWIG